MACSPETERGQLLGNSWLTVIEGDFCKYCTKSDLLLFIFHDATLLVIHQISVKPGEVRELSAF